MALPINRPQPRRDENVPPVEPARVSPPRSNAPLPGLEEGERGVSPSAQPSAPALDSTKAKGERQSSVSEESPRSARPASSTPPSGQQSARRQVPSPGVAATPRPSVAQAQGGSSPSARQSSSRGPLTAREEAEGWRIDPKTGVKHKQMPKMEFSGKNPATATPKPLDPDFKFDLDDLVGEASLYLAHLRVPPTPEEEAQMKRAREQAEERRNREYESIQAALDKERSDREEAREDKKSSRRKKG